MLQVIGASLPSVVAVAVSPMPLVGLLFLLIGRGRGAAALWTLGWFAATLLGIGLGAALGASSAGRASSGGEDGVNWAAWVFAVLFLVLSYRSFAGMPSA
ncbi:hypothetical protein SGUI_2538 [Serinicoccus hydrothermalis]|uniref:Uncharacterized protein n=1 Tax=Serinicoccus hydrothermalis TaxID=1758689 RepID=A0A1B1NES1_9MICO|nr:hypothetical protein [Serinicoccus hydrothermalis]ANS79934.1 hypothetical protein SGUI_2538 [Serinicoccus hydrothermalis]